MADQGVKLGDIRVVLDGILGEGTMGTIGVSFRRSADASTRTHGEVYDLGLGIHGEAGVRSLEYLNADETMREMLAQLTATGVGHVTLQQGMGIIFGWLLLRD